MGSKLETKAFTEGFHLRHRNHLSSRAAQHDDMSVIDQPLQLAHSSRICCRKGSAFSDRISAGTSEDCDRRILRTVEREIPRTLAISPLLTF